MPFLNYFSPAFSGRCLAERDRWLRPAGNYTPSQSAVADSSPKGEPKCCFRPYNFNNSVFAQQTHLNALHRRIAFSRASTSAASENACYVRTPNALKFASGNPTGGFAAVKTAYHAVFALLPHSSLLIPHLALRASTPHS